MKNSIKSSITLPTAELELVNELMKVLKAKTKVDVIRRGLALLKESTDKKILKASFKEASEATRKSNILEIASLDHLSNEGLD